MVVFRGGAAMFNDVTSKAADGWKEGEQNNKLKGRLEDGFSNQY